MLCFKAKRLKLDQTDDDFNYGVVPADSGRGRHNLRSRATKTYVEPSEDVQLELAIANSIATSKKKVPLTTPQRQDFADYSDFEDLFTYKSHIDIPVRMEDYKCLDRRELITNTLLDFYLQYFYNEKLTEELREKVHIFSSQFYTIYSTDSNYKGWKDESIKTLSASEKRYQKVQGLPSNNVNIFDKDFLVFPCLDNEHWFLVIVCFPRLGRTEEIPVDGTENASEADMKQSVILCFDSVRGNPPRRTKAIRHIRNFLESEYQQKHQNDFPFVKSDLVGSHIPSPQQSSATDCGLFVIEFVEHFFLKSPIRNFRQVIDCSEWFDPIIIESHEKRKEIASLVKSMITNVGVLLPPISFVNDVDSQLPSEQIIIENDKNNNSEKKADQNNPTEDSSNKLLSQLKDTDSEPMEIDEVKESNDSPAAQVSQQDFLIHGQEKEELSHQNEKDTKSVITKTQLETSLSKLKELMDRSQSRPETSEAEEDIPTQENPDLVEREQEKIEDPDSEIPGSVSPTKSDDSDVVCLD